MLNNNKKLYTTIEVARKCGMSYYSVARWVNRCRINFPWQPEQQVSLDDFIAFINNNDLNVLSRNSNQKPTVLIVEDEDNVASSIGRVFLRNGFEIFVAGNGFKAGVLLKQENPQIVTIDLSMEDLDGYDVLKIIQSLKLSTKAWIIIISGNSQDCFEKAIEMGADFYLKKPFSKTDLEKIINRIYPKTA